MNKNFQSTCISHLYHHLFDTLDYLTFCNNFLNANLNQIKTSKEDSNTAVKKDTLKHYSVYACGVKLWTLHDCHVTTIEGTVYTLGQ